MAILTFTFTSNIPVYYAFNSKNYVASSDKIDLTLVEGNTLNWDTSNTSIGCLVLVFKKDDTTTQPNADFLKSDGTSQASVKASNSPSNNFNFGDGSYIQAYNIAVGRTGGVVTNNATNVHITGTPILPKYTVTTTLENATCNIASGTEYNEGESVTITVNANSGYYFETAPTVDGVSMTMVSDKEYTSTITINSNVSVVASAVVKPIVKYSITTTLENATCNIASGTEYNEGESVTITVTANTGYYFETAPTVDGVSMTMVSDKEYTSTITINSNVSVVASAVVEPTKYTVTTTLENATCNIASGTQYTEGSEVTITVNANSGYTFETAPTVDGVSMTKVSDTEYTSTITINSNVSVVASAVVIKEKYTVKLELSNATCNINDTTEYIKGDPLEIRVETVSNYYFATTPYISYYIQGASQKQDFTTVQTTEYKTIYTCIISGDITGSWATNEYQKPYIHAIGQVIPTPEVDKYGIITIYNPTSDELTNISKVRYQTVGGGVVDLGQYITRLHRLFIPITTSDRAVVMLGGYNTNVESGVVNSDIVTLSCGELTINEVYENENDYKNTQCEIYLPFIGYNTINTVDIMNKTITLEYRVNVITGDCLAILKANGIVINSYSGNCSFKIPYIINESSLVNELDINSEYLNDFTPYILIKRKEGSNNSLTTSDKKAPLQAFTGLTYIDIAFIQINAPRQEIDLIESVLQSGVIV